MDRLHPSLDRSSLLLCRFRGDGTLTYVNDGYCRAFAATRADLVGKNLRTLVPAADQPNIERLLASLLSGVRDYIHEHRAVAPDGSVRWMSWTNVPLDDEGSEFEGVGLDITDRKETEERLRIANDRFELVSRATRDGIWDYDPITGVNTWTPHCFEMLGLPSDHPPLITQKWIEARMHPDDYSKMWKAAEDYFAGRTPMYTAEMRLRHEDGTYRWFLSRGIAIKGPNGEIVRMAGALSDDHDRRAAEEALRASEERKRIAVQAAGLGIYEWNIPEDRSFWENERMYDIFGRRPEEGPIDRVTFMRDYVHPDDAQAFLSDIRGAMQRRDVFRTTYRIRHGGVREAIRWVELVGSYSFDAAGEPLKLIGVAADITERRLAEKAVKDSEASIRRFIDTANEGILRVDAQDRIVYANERHCSLLGYELHELVGQDVLIFVFPEDRERALGRRGERRAGRGERYETRLRRKDGREVWVLNSTVTVFDEGRYDGTYTMVADLTERRRAEEALREAKERFQLALRRAPVTLFNQDRELRYTWLHNALAPFDGEASVGKTDHDVFAPEEAAALEGLKRGVLESGSGIRTEIAIHPDRVAHHFDLTIEPIVGEDGVVRGIACAALDVTGLKRAEAELREADRHKDEFLATLAHELRNPLAPIRTALELLKRVPDSVETSARARAVMDRQLTHLVRLIDDLLDVSRIGRGKLELRRELVELRVILDAAVEATQALVASRQHTLSVQVPEQVIWLLADPTRLSQVVSNLLNNAAKYMPQGGRIDVQASVAAGELVLTVADTGFGIGSEDLERVFEIFTQLERPGSIPRSGLGIGLALVRRLVEMHGGRVHAESEGPGRGSTFVVRLPLAAAPEKPAGAAAREAAPTTSRRVLVIDDNVEAAETLTDLLRLGGHEARPAFDGLSGLAMIAEFRPHVVFCDLGMPGIDGYEVARRLRAAAPSPPPMLIALTGWGSPEDRKRSADAGFDLHLIKPVMASTVAEILTRAARTT